MGFMNKVRQAAETATDMSAVAADKVNELLDEYKNAMDVLGRFGFTVGKFEVEMWLLPHVSTSIDGSIDAIDEASVKQTIAAQHEHGLLVAILNSLLTAKGISERVNLKYRGVTANVTIGIPPHISIGFH